MMLLNPRTTAIQILWMEHKVQKDQLTRIEIFVLCEPRTRQMKSLQSKTHELPSEVRGGFPIGESHFLWGPPPPESDSV